MHPAWDASSLGCIQRGAASALCNLKVSLVHAWVGQIVTFFAYRPPSRPQGSLTPTQPGRVTNPTQGHPAWAALGSPSGIPQAE